MKGARRGAASRRPVARPIARPARAATGLAKPRNRRAGRPNGRAAASKPGPSNRDVGPGSGEPALGTIRPLTAEDLDAARLFLTTRDPRLASLIERVGPCQLAEGRSRAPFAALVRAILWQQLSGKAAETIHGRVLGLLGGPEQLTPAALLALDPAALRAAGVSRPKIAYLRDLAARVQDGRLDLDALEHAADEDVITAITAVKGLGRWSAEMFLMFRLNRPDVFPLGDLGIVKGVQILLGMKRRPKPVTMMRAAEAWRPYRSVAAWYLWRLLE